MPFKLEFGCTELCPSCDALWSYKECVRPYLYHKIQAAKLQSKKSAYSKATRQKMLPSIAIYNFEKILGFLRIPWYVLQIQDAI